MDGILTVFVRVVSRVNFVKPFSTQARTIIVNNIFTLLKSKTRRDCEFLFRVPKSTGISYKSKSSEYWINAKCYFATFGIFGVNIFNFISSKCTRFHIIISYSTGIIWYYINII